MDIQKEAARTGVAGERILVTRRCAALADAVVFTTSPRLMNDADRKTVNRVEEAARRVIKGRAAIATCTYAPATL